MDGVLVSDSNPTYNAFCNTENITHESVNLSQSQRVFQGAYHVQNVNVYQSRLKLSMYTQTYTHHILLFYNIANTLINIT